MTHNHIWNTIDNNKRIYTLIIFKALTVWIKCLYIIRTTADNYSDIRTVW